MPYLPHAALYTDYYELTMAQGYFLAGNKDVHATFDYFFRNNPFEGGFVVFAGLSDLLPILRDLHFEEEDLAYLHDQGFRDDFLDYLRDFKFRGEILAPTEGEIVFPSEPVMRVRGNIIETQVIETLLLNVINYESLIATKAARMRLMAGPDRLFIDFGLRRSQGWGGIQASKAAIIGGADSTSNVFSAFHYDLKPSGTQAHSWVQSFDDELTAFRKYAEFYPDACVLLADTYNTLESGVPNAITVAKELEEKGHQLLGIRLDSGDLAYLGRKARAMLDNAGLKYVKIAVSNQLDEHLIKSLIDQDAPIDIFGVGTRLVTGHDSPALDGVYKLSSIDHQPKLKHSENITKVNLPGVKKIFRHLQEDGSFYADSICLDDQDEISDIYHPFYPKKHTSVHDYKHEELLHKVMGDGMITTELDLPANSAKYVQKRLGQLQKEHLRFENPHYYKVGLSKKLLDLRNRLLNGN